MNSVVLYLVFTPLRKLAYLTSVYYKDVSSIVFYILEYVGWEWKSEIMEQHQFTNANQK